MTNREFKTCVQLESAYKEFVNLTGDLLETKPSEVFIAGGAIGSFLRQEQPNDIDIYFNNYDMIANFIDYIMEKYNINKNIENKNSIIYKTKDKNPKPGELLFMTRNAMTFKGKRYNFQVITKFYGDPEGVIDCFDFASTQVYYDILKSKLYYYSEYTIKSIYEKEIIYTGSEYPLSSLFRIKKYLDKGWNIYVMSLIKLAYDIYNTNLNDPKVLAEQLEGVDIVILNELVDYIKNNQQNIADITFGKIESIFNQINELK